MKKALFLSLALLSAFLFAPVAWAEHVSPSQALARLSSKRMAPRRTTSSLKLAEKVGNLYIFSDKEGYIVLPNDDSAPALLGYSDQPFDADINPNLAYWLDNLSREINFLAKSPRKAVERSVEHEPIAPMVTTRWNQSAPYNNDCPLIGDKRCLTGCVATAMAQVIKYHNYPQKGTGTFSYTWNGQDLTFDYGNATFAWEDMEDTYDSSSSEASKAAVAQLMYACGVGVKMNYGVNESGATTPYAPYALINFFNFDKATWSAQRNAYGLEEWENLIYNELRENRPVLYSGSGAESGHAFVCDGYSENGYFHFNWGWGGMSDGYFLLTALNPGSLGAGGGSGGYNFFQSAVIGAQPAKDGSELIYTIYNMYDNFGVSEESAATGSDVTFLGYFLSCTPETISNLYLGVKFQPENGGEAQYAFTPSPFTDVKFYQALGDFPVTLPSDLTDGNYTVTPVFRVEDRDWKEIPSFMDVTGKLYADVNDGSVTFTTPVKPTIAVSDIVPPPELYLDKTAPFSYVITNPGDNEYVGIAYPYLLDSDDNIIAEGSPIPVDLLGKGSRTYTAIPTSFTAYQTGAGKYADFKAGDYMLEFRDDLDNTISDKVAVTVKDAPAEETQVQVTELKLVNENPVYDRDAIEFSVTLECSEGYFAGFFNFVVFPDTGSGLVKSVYDTQTPYYYLSKGESETKTLTVDLSSLDYGKYRAQMFNGNLSSGNPVYFELKQKIGTGIEEITADPENETIYNLFGVKCTRPLPPGIYIINGTKTHIK